jgi:hypothetical protein
MQRIDMTYPEIMPVIDVARHW